MLLDFDDNSAGQLSYAAVAIKQFTEGQSHVGIIYRDELQVFLLHLAWNYRLINENFDGSYQWALLGLSAREQKIIAGLCTLIADNEPDIPYGLDTEGYRFDPDTGDLNAGELGKGMTCATFVLLVLSAFGYEILARDEWPLGANIEWQENIIRSLERTSAPREQLDAISRDVGARRFSPEEVIGASSVSAWPVSFEEAQRLAAIAREQVYPPQA